MTDSNRYATPAGVEAAIAAAARGAFAKDPSLSIQERIRLEYFHRFLSRVFSDADDSEWMLKGGTSMLARVASARSTTDVDLFRRNQSLESALVDLRRLANVDLDDHFQFNFVQYTDAIDGNQQAYAEGYQVRFDVYIGAKKKDSFHVDLVVNTAMTGDVEIIPPANALDLPRLTSHPYRLYPVVDQIADKVCATLALYNGKPSSREKDLIDLVVLAVTQDVDAHKLRNAIEVESRIRSLPLPGAFIVPSMWGTSYAKLAAKVPACDNYRTIEDAKSLMRAFIDSALEGSVIGKTWDHTQARWV